MEAARIGCSTGASAMADKNAAFRTKNQAGHDAVDAHATHMRFEAGAVRWHRVEEGDPKRPAFLQLRGRPDSWHSSSEVLPPLDPANRHIVPDMRGYGRSTSADMDHNWHRPTTRRRPSSTASASRNPARSAMTKTPHLERHGRRPPRPRPRRRANGSRPPFPARSWPQRARAHRDSLRRMGPLHLAARAPGQHLAGPCRAPRAPPPLGGARASKPMARLSRPTERGLETRRELSEALVELCLEKGFPPCRSRTSPTASASPGRTHPGDATADPLRSLGEPPRVPRSRRRIDRLLRAHRLRPPRLAGDAELREAAALRRRFGKYADFRHITATIRSCAGWWLVQAEPCAPAEIARMTMGLLLQGLGRQ